jgi:hypothetical protein
MTERLEGYLNEVECFGEAARLRIATDAGFLMLAIEDPTQVILKGNVPETVQLECGRQKPTLVVVEYEKPDLKHGTRGVVRSIEFKE